MNKAVLLAVLLSVSFVAGLNNTVSPFDSFADIEAGVNLANSRLLTLEGRILEVEGLVREQRNITVSSREFVITWAVALSLTFGIINYFFWRKLVLRVQQERFKLEAERKASGIAPEKEGSGLNEF